MELTYIKLYHDFLQEVSPLTDQEIGVLIKAMLLYSRSEPIPEGLLTGSARILFPRWQLQIDRDRAAYAKRCETNRQNALKRDYASPAPAPRPAPPTLSEVRDYCKAQSLKTDPDYFFNYYQATGWSSGGHPIADWQAKLLSWNAKDRSTKPAQTNPALDYAQREYVDDDHYFIDLSEYADPVPDEKAG